MAEVRREWLDRDYYKDLGLNQGASDEEIKEAYKKLVRKLHPDRNPGNNTAEDRFKQVSSAYEVIGDSETRKQYDQVRQAGIFGAGPGSGAGQGSRSYQHFNFDQNDLFSSLFGNGINVPLRGTDYETTADLTFGEAMAGAVKTVPAVNKKMIKVRIPAGVADRERIRISGKGGQGSNGGPRGDLYVRVSVQKHDLYERQGQNLVLEVPLSFEEAVLGTNLKVPTYSGKQVEIRIPSGTGSGRTFRIKGHGVPNPKGKTGDLLAKVTVDVPQKLSPKQKKAIQELGELMDFDPRSHLYKKN